MILSILDPYLPNRIYAFTLESHGIVNEFILHFELSLVEIG